jgi:hypothetical protein
MKSVGRNNDHDTLIERIQDAFPKHFARDGIVVHVHDASHSKYPIDASILVRAGISEAQREVLPEIVIHHPASSRLFLIETAAGPVAGYEARQRQLRELLRNTALEAVFVRAYQNREALAADFEFIPWGSVVWLAEEPGHMIHFGGKGIPRASLA